MSEERLVGEEARKTYPLKLKNGFISRYLSGPNILDIGYKGYLTDVVPIVPQAVGVDLDYPGYDGRRLPFADASQDAVFASHCLEHIEDFAQALRDWHRVLRIGGYMVVMVPHQFLYEKRIELPSLFNADHKRFYTPAFLLADVEASLPPNTYRVRHLADNDIEFDYSIPPERHAGGCYEIELVLEKIAGPVWALAQPASPRPQPPSARLFARESTAPEDAGGVKVDSVRIKNIPAAPWDVALYDFGARMPKNARILVLQLGHRGDFIIGLPALGKLRDIFPHGEIHLVVGSWNRGAAETCGLADTILTHDHFPENARDWKGTPQEDEDSLLRKAAAHYHIAIDLRVDEDTRHLLGVLNADMRCGIGSKARFPYLDVVLPHHRVSMETGLDGHNGNVLLGPERFYSDMPRKSAFRHETGFRRHHGFLVYGPYLRLPAGTFRAFFGLDLRARPLRRAKTLVRIEVVQGKGRILASRDLNSGDFGASADDRLFLDFDIEDTETPCEFRVFLTAFLLRSRLGFAGVNLIPLEKAPQPRGLPAELHIGEQASLLVDLLADRTRTLYNPPEQAALPALPSNLPIPAAARRFVIAPVSNSSLRDWPVEHYVGLISRLLQHFDCAVLLIGAREQTGVLAHIVQSASHPARVVNLGGRLSWQETAALIGKADLVISNNSGIGHLAASLGARTLAIYSASHQPQEWGPRGSRSRAIMASVPCSPCGLDRLADCSFGHACMQGLLPETVFNQVVASLEAA